MAMAFSSLPSNFLTPSPETCFPPSSLFFDKFHPQILFMKRFRPQKFKIVCCQQTVEVDIGTQKKTNSVKKKRKPRQSFLEQIQNKWSVRTPSLRESFPWQEQETSCANQEFQAQSSLFSSDVSSSDTESGKLCSVSEPPLNSHSKIKSSSAPWIHGNEPRKEALNPKGSGGSQEPFVSVIQGSSNSLKEIVLVRESEEKCEKFAETPNGLPKKVEILGAKESETVAPVVNDLLTTYRVTKSTKCSSVDANDLKRLPWVRKTDENFLANDNKLRSKNTEVAERLIPEHELKILRNVSLRMPERIKVGAAGITQALVDAIYDKWKHEEVVKLKFEGHPLMNMKRTHEFLENRTGGLVIWRSGGLVVLYRGMAYKLDCTKSYIERVEADSGELGEDFTESIKTERLNGDEESYRLYNSSYINNLSKQEQVDLHELNHLLDELGPRFVDWSGREPLPVDADLLPAVILGYRAPFRLLPHGVKQALKNKEMTYLRRTARLMPPHFALGRNRELQGLAVAIVKLWEKSAIAKIVIKRGVQNTSNERMAEGLKILTGGTLLSRNKEFMVFYRGNDFLPPSVSYAFLEKERIATFQQEEEEQARERATALIDTTTTTTTSKPYLKNKSKRRLVVGTLAETLAATS
ncbi:hypothetical protein OROMI_018917 [Orobanche minor]